jgi:hypothetical protein
MPLHLGWPDIALRLGLAFVAACLVGLDRGHMGEAAGLRTTVLPSTAGAGERLRVRRRMGGESRQHHGARIRPILGIQLSPARAEVASRPRGKQRSRTFFAGMSCPDGCSPDKGVPTPHRYVAGMAGPQGPLAPSALAWTGR